MWENKLFPHSFQSKKITLHKRQRVFTDSVTHQIDLEEFVVLNHSDIFKIVGIGPFDQVFGDQATQIFAFLGISVF